MHPNWFSAYLNQHPTVNHFKLEGARISYRHWSNKDKPGLLFVHGYAAHASWWDFIAPAFTDSYDVVAIDLSGSGESDHRQAYSSRLFAREIADCITASGMVSATIVGHSFGGAMTRNAAFLCPQRINGIVLADSYLTSQKQESKRTPLPRGATRYYPTLSEATKRFRLRPPQPRPMEFVLNYIAERSVRKTANGWCFKHDPALFAKLTQDTDLRSATEMLRDLKIPVGMIYGRESRFFPSSKVKKLETLVSKELIIGIPNAHHHVFLDQPIPFIKALALVLRRQSSS